MSTITRYFLQIHKYGVKHGDMLDDNILIKSEKIVENCYEPKPIRVEEQFNIVDWGMAWSTSDENDLLGRSLWLEHEALFEHCTWYIGTKNAYQWLEKAMKTKGIGDERKRFLMDLKDREGTYERNPHRYDEEWRDWSDEEWTEAQLYDEHALVCWNSEFGKEEHIENFLQVLEFD